MSIKGGKIDASGEFIKSFRIVTDIDADAGLGTPTDPLRVDPTGTTVQPVSFNSAQHVIVDSGASGGTQYADGATQATPTGTVALGKDPSNVLKSLPLTAGGALKVDNSAVTQPISAVSLPLPTGAALDATLTGGTQQTKITDGTNIATVKAASTAAIATDKAVVVAVSPNNTIAATQSGTWTVQPGNTANTTAWKVDGSAVTQPVSATSLPLPTGASTSALQSETHGTVTPGTAATKSDLAGAIAQVSTVPAATDGQQVAIQTDSAGSLRISPYGNTGAAKVVTVTGAGNTTISTGPASGKKWYVYGGVVKVVTNATVANRVPNVNMQDASGNPTTSNYASVATTASLTRFYPFGPGLPQAGAFIQDVCTLPIPNVLIPPLGKMFSSIAAGVAGDTITMFLNILELAD
jgi:hypothetical protein